MIPNWSRISDYDIQTNAKQSQCKPVFIDLKIDRRRRRNIEPTLNVTSQSALAPRRGCMTVPDSNYAIQTFEKVRCFVFKTSTVFVNNMSAVL